MGDVGNIVIMRWLVGRLPRWRLRGVERADKQVGNKDCDKPAVRVIIFAQS